MSLPKKVDFPPIIHFNNMVFFHLRVSSQFVSSLPQKCTPKGWCHVFWGHYWMSDTQWSIWHILVHHMIESKILRYMPNVRCPGIHILCALTMAVVPNVMGTNILQQTFHSFLLSQHFKEVLGSLWFWGGQCVELLDTSEGEAKWVMLVRVWSYPLKR